MSFRRSVNKHDWWEGYRSEFGVQYEELGIPLALLDTVQRLIDFLTSGVDESTGYQLEQLGQQDFWILFQLVTSTFDYQAATFTALEKRRLARNH